MKPGGGSKKGGAYEREKCLEISKWVLVEAFDGERIFRRSEMSGGSHTNSKKRGKDQYKEQLGDIASCDPRGDKLISLIGIELKHRSDIDVQQLIYDSAPKSEHILSWWREHYELATQANKVPVLIARQNFKPDILLVHSLLAAQLKDLTVLGSFPQHKCTIFDWKEFLEKVEYWTFINSIIAIYGKAL